MKTIKPGLTIRDLLGIISSNPKLSLNSEIVFSVHNPNFTENNGETRCTITWCPDGWEEDHGDLNFVVVDNIKIPSKNRGV